MSVTFPDLCIALWRPVLPPDDLERADRDDEYRGGLYWATVGVGVRGYIDHLLSLE